MGSISIEDKSGLSLVSIHYVVTRAKATLDDAQFNSAQCKAAISMKGKIKKFTIEFDGPEEWPTVEQVLGPRVVKDTPQA